MATETTTPSTTSIHWVLYGVLSVLILFLIWLWHDTSIMDAAQVAQVVTARATQATDDKQAATSIKEANDSLQKRNTDLQSQLATAKTLNQQITLLNKEAGTHIPTPTQEQVDAYSRSLQSSLGIVNGANPPGSKPLPVTEATVPIPAVDFQKIVADEVQLSEDSNQLAADALTIQVQQKQINDRDTTISDQTTEITTLKGGSHLKRFLKATEHVAIGVAVGVVVDRLVKK